MLIWKAHSRMIDALAFSPDGRTLALAGCYLACRLIDAATGRRLWTAGSGTTFALSLAFAPDGHTVLGRDHAFTIYSAADGAELRRVGGTWCQSFGPLPDGRTAFVADGGHQDRVGHYDLATGERIREVSLGDVGAINRAAASPDGKLVALVGCKRFCLLTAAGGVIAQAKERALSSGAFALAFSPDSRSVVFTAGRTLFVWNAATAQETHRVQLAAKYFMDAAFTPDGRRLITVSKEGAARVWDTATWACERSFEWDAGPLRAVAVAADGMRAAVAGDSGRVVVWDLDE